jgi:hypothetical protein
MAVTAKLYSQFPWYLGGSNTAGNASIDLLSHTPTVALTTSTNSISQTADALYADVTNELATAGGYTSGGAALGSPQYTTSSLTTTFDAADTSWTTATFTAAQAHIYAAGLAANPVKPLISYVDFGADQSVSSGTFTLQWNASGIFTIVVA